MSINYHINRVLLNFFASIVVAKSTNFKTLGLVESLFVKLKNIKLSPVGAPKFISNLFVAVTKNKF